MLYYNTKDNKDFKVNRTNYPVLMQHMSSIVIAINDDEMIAISNRHTVSKKEVKQVIDTKQSKTGIWYIHGHRNKLIEICRTLFSYKYHGTLGFCNFVYVMNDTVVNYGRYGIGGWRNFYTKWDFTIDLDKYGNELSHINGVRTLHKSVDLQDMLDRKTIWKIGSRRSGTIVYLCVIPDIRLFPEYYKKWKETH